MADLLWNNIHALDEEPSFLLEHQPLDDLTQGFVVGKALPARGRAMQTSHSSAAHAGA